MGEHQERGESAQWDSPLTELPSPRGEEERDRPFSVVSELEPFWLWWSVAEAALDDVAEGLAFSLKSVMMTVRSPTVTSRCWALLRSMFFNLGLAGKRRGVVKSCSKMGPTVNLMAFFRTLSVSPHLLVTVLLQRRLSVALLPLCSLLLFLFGLCGQHELLRYLLLGDGARLPGGRRGKSGRLITVQKRHVASRKSGTAVKGNSSAAEATMTLEHG